MENYCQRISEVKELIKNADYILIGAGAGLSTAAGLEYAGESFERNYKEFIEKYGFQDLYSASFYNFNTQEEKWAFFAKMIQLNRFNKEINSIINTYSIKEITAERFLVRSQHLKGISTELVSFMLGILSTKRHTKLVIAAQWKNWINSNDKELLNTLYILYNHLETHQIDAVLIGYYVYSLNIQEALKFFKDSRKCQHVPIMKITNSQNVVTKSVKTGQIKQKQDV